MSKAQPRLAFVAASSEEALQAAEVLIRRYDGCAPDEADIVVALGGDGFMLETLHRRLGRARTIYGMNRGTVGFLMNSYSEDGLLERLQAAQPVQLYPLVMRATDTEGRLHEDLAFNEVSLLRQSRQAAKVRILVDDKVRLEELVCDGVLVATPAGSTAYNLSAHGPIVPIGARLLCLTPISAFRPRRWRGALLSDQARVKFEILTASKRPVSATADSTEVRNVATVEVRQDKQHQMTLLFDADHNLEERILLEQFTP